MKNATIFALAALLLVVAVSANQKETRLSISGPAALVEKIKLFNKQYKNREDDPIIECELANFGSVQYGSRISGEAHVSNPYRACNKTEVLNHEFSRIPFLIIERGDCAFADKVLVAQEAGASIAVIVDNGPTRGNVIMIDNGHGYNVHITSVFISQDYGNIIKSFVENNKGTQIYLSLELNQKKVEKSLVRLWIDPSSPYTNKLIHSFNPVRAKIAKNSFVTEPIFDISKRTDSKVIAGDSNCGNYRNGKVQYCAPDPDQPQGDDIANKSNVATGLDVLNETVRQLCIHKQGEDLWYQYYDAFSSDCYFTPQQYQICSIISLKKVPKLDLELYQSCLANESAVMAMLDAQVENNDSYNIFEWPAVTINDMLYRGNLEGDLIAEGICNSLYTIDDDCLDIIDPQGMVKRDPSSSSSGSSNVFLTLVLVVIGFAAAFLLTAYVYKRIVRREISQDVDQKVNQMVSQYIAFYESRGKNSGDHSSDL